MQFAWSMARALALIALLAAVLSSAASARSLRRPLVVDGSTAFQPPATVRLNIKHSEGSGTCSGTLIATNAVVTASHCFYGKSGVSGTVTNEAAGQALAFKSVTMHPDYT